MAARQSRKSTTTTTTVTKQMAGGDETPQSTYSPRRRGERSPSPARSTRMEEKQQLQNLNDRLAAYIDRVRFLENENSRLSTQVRSTEETITKEVTNIKSLYESELADARKLLDETAKEKARLQIEAGKYKAQADDWQTKFHKKDRDLKNAEKRIAELEALITDLQNKLADSESQRKHFEREYNSARSDLLALERQLATAKKQLEEETLLRVDLENRVQSLKEDIAFKSSVYEQELNETRTRTTTQIDEVDADLREDYEAKLQDALQGMRDTQDEQIQNAKYEIETIYERKVGDLQSTLDRSQNAGVNTREELITTRRRLDELSSEVTKLRAMNAEYESRISDLENQLKREQDEFLHRLAEKDAEMADLRMQLDDQTKEFADLLDVKIRLDTEIAAYRKLLESEEDRLNLSQSLLDKTSTPRKGTPVRGQKRKRVTTSESLEHSSSSDQYASTAEAKGSVEIYETDTEGKYIKLHNTSDKDIHLGGWQVKHVANGEETVFKFHRSLILKGETFTTIWSAGSGQTHSPPADLVMKGQKWFIADEMKTTLHNNDGDEMASRELKKSQLKSVSSYRSSIRGDDHAGREGVDKDKCSVM